LINVFLAFCVLGADFLICFLFQLVYGESAVLAVADCPRISTADRKSLLRFTQSPHAKVKSGQPRESSRCLGSLPGERRRCRCATISVNDSSDNLGQAQ